MGDLWWYTMDGANHRNTVDWPTSHNLLFLTPKYRLPVLNRGKRPLNLQTPQHLEESNILKLLRSSDLTKVNVVHSPSNEVSLRPSLPSKSSTVGKDFISDIHLREVLLLTFLPDLQSFERTW